MNRSIRKGPFIFFKLLKKRNYIQNYKLKITFKTWSRTSVILPCMIKSTISIHNGLRHIPFFIKKQNIGYKLGEFVITKFFYSHTKNEKKIQHLKKK